MFKEDVEDILRTMPAWSDVTVKETCKIGGVNTVFIWEIARLNSNYSDGYTMMEHRRSKSYQSDLDLDDVISKFGWWSTFEVSAITMRE